MRSSSAISLLAVIIISRRIGNVDYILYSLLLASFWNIFFIHWLYTQPSVT